MGSRVRYYVPDPWPEWLTDFFQEYVKRVPEWETHGLGLTSDELSKAVVSVFGKEWVESFREADSTDRREIFRPRTFKEQKHFGRRLRKLGDALSEHKLGGQVPSIRSHGGKQGWGSHSSSRHK